MDGSWLARRPLRAVLGALVRRSLVGAALGAVTAAYDAALGGAASAPIADAGGAAQFARLTSTRFELRGVSFDAPERVVFDAAAILPNNRRSRSGWRPRELRLAARRRRRARSRGRDRLSRDRRRRGARLHAARAARRRRRAAAAPAARLVFANPELKVSPGWPLPDVWLPIGSGVGVSLGERPLESIRGGRERHRSSVCGSPTAAADVAGEAGAPSRRHPA